MREVEPVLGALDVDPEKEAQRPHVLDGEFGTEAVDNVLEQGQAGPSEHNVIDVEEEICDVRAATKDEKRRVKALVWFWLIDETLSANLVYQSDYKIGSTTPSDEAMMKIMTMVMA